MFKERLKELRHKDLYRQSKVHSPELFNFSSNDYLGLSKHPDVVKASLKAAADHGAGAGASRLICGTTILHQELEKKLAKFKHCQSSLVFPTGYMANLGAISAVVGMGDAIIVDELNHASIIDGTRLSGARLLVYKHKDTKRLKTILERYRKRFKNVLIVTDSLFSMDGDIAPLPEICALAKHYKCLSMVDEAHATGVFGPNGEGLVEHFGLGDKVDIIMGTLSKALGSLGGYIAGSKELIEYLTNTSRSFIYSTALPPACCGAALKAIEIVQKDVARRERLWENIRYFTENSEFRIQSENPRSKIQDPKS
ncbi:MAG: 8-amino-7-oxononanoate synthase, partial [Candidatus Margulisiibacteriota bacterium]